MKKMFIIVAILLPFLISCNQNPAKNNKAGGSVADISVVDTNANTNVNLIPDDAVYQIEHAYIKYTSTMGVIREVWFSQFGNLQYEEAYRLDNDKKTGTCSYVIDGYKYDMQLGSKEAVKTPYRAEPATEYEKLTAQEKEKYGVAKIGNESVLKRYCTIVSFDKPMKTTVWLYKGIPLKSVSVNRNEELTIEATIFDENPIDSAKFVLPTDIKVFQF